MRPADEADCAKVGKMSRKQRTVSSLFSARVLQDMANRERGHWREVGTGSLTVQGPAREFVFYLQSSGKLLKDFQQEI